MFPRCAVGLLSMLCLAPALADPPAATSPTPPASSTPAGAAATAPAPATDKPAAEDADVKHFLAEGFKPEMHG